MTEDINPEDDVVMRVVADTKPFMDAIADLRGEINSINDILESEGKAAEAEVAERWANVANKIAAEWVKINQTVGANLEQISAKIGQALQIDYNQFKVLHQALQEQGAFTARNQEEVNAKLDASEDARARSGAERLAARMAQTEELAAAVNAASVESVAASGTEVDAQRKLKAEINLVNRALEFQAERTARLKALSVEMIEASQAAAKGMTPARIQERYGAKIREASVFAGLGAPELTEQGLTGFQAKIERIVVAAERLSTALQVGSEGFQRQLTALKEEYGAQSVIAKKIDEVNDKRAIAAGRLEELQRAEAKATAGEKSYAAEIDKTTRELAEYEAQLARITALGFKMTIGGAFAGPEAFTMRASQVGGDPAKRMESIRQEVLKQVLNTFVGDAEVYMKAAGIGLETGPAGPTQVWGKQFEQAMRDLLIQGGEASLDEFSRRTEGLVEGYAITGEADWLPRVQKDLIVDFKAVTDPVRKGVEEYVANVGKLGSAGAAFEAIAGPKADQIRQYVAQLSLYGQIFGRTTGRLFFGPSLAQAPKDISGAPDPLAAARMAMAQKSYVDFPLLSGAALKPELARTRAAYGEAAGEERTAATLRDAVLKSNQLVALKLKEKLIADEIAAAEKEILETQTKRAAVAEDITRLEQENVPAKEQKAEAARMQDLPYRTSKERVAAEEELASALKIREGVESDLNAAQVRREKAVKSFTADQSNLNKVELRVAEEQLSKTQQLYEVANRHVNQLREKVAILKQQEQVLKEVDSIERRPPPATLQQAEATLGADRATYAAAVRNAQIQEQAQIRAKRARDLAIEEERAYRERALTGGLSDLEKQKADVTMKAYQRYVIETSEAYKEVKAQADEAAKAAARYKAILDATLAQTNLTRVVETRAGAPTAQTENVQKHVKALQQEATQIGTNASAREALRKRVLEYILTIEKLIRTNREAQAQQDVSFKRAGAVSAQKEVVAAEKDYQALLLQAGTTSGVASEAALRRADAVSAQIPVLRGVAAAANDDTVATKNNADALRSQGAVLMQSKENLKGVAKGLKDTTKESESWEHRLFSLRKVAQVFFGSFLAQVAYGVMGAVRQFFTDTIESARKLSDAIVKLDVTTRASQRLMGAAAGTATQWHKAVAGLRVEFANFSLAEWNTAATQGQMIMREYGLSFEDMQKMLTAAAHIAIMNNLDLSETVQNVSRATRESLRQLNQYVGKINEEVDLNERSIAMYGKKFDALVNEEKQQVRIAELYERATRNADDLNAVLGTQTSLLVQAKTRGEDAAATLGKVWASQMGILQMAWAGILEGAVQATPILMRFFNWITDGLSRIYAVLFAVSNAWRVWTGQMSEEELVKQAEAVRLLVVEKLSVKEGGLPDVTGEGGPKPVEIPEEILNATKELYDELEKMKKDHDKAVLDAGKKRDADLVQAELDHLTSIGEIDKQWRDARIEAVKQAADEEKKIRKDAAKEIADTIRKYEEDVAKFKSDFEKDEARRDEDHRLEMEDDRRQEQEKEQDDLKKHLDKLKDIHDKYYFQLLDAIRERDARAVLLALRNRNKELADENTTYAENVRKRAEDAGREHQDKEAKYQREKQRRLADYAEQLDEMRQQHEAQLVEIERRRQEEIVANKAALGTRLKELDDAREAELEAEETAYNIRKIKIGVQYDKDLIDLDAAMKDQTDAYAQGWADKYNVTEDYLTQIYNLMVLYFGPGGMVDQLYRSALEGIQVPEPDLNLPTYYPAEDQPAPHPSPTFEDQPSYRPEWWPSQRPGQWPTSLLPSQWAEGGSFVTNGPEVHMFGEGADPRELVTAIPLSKLSQLGMGGGVAGGPGTRLEVHVTADEHFAVGVEDKIFMAIADVVREMTPVRGRR